MRAQPTFFDADRSTLEDALELTAESLRTHGEKAPHWAIAFSGGKDSAATLSAVLHLLEQGRVPAPKSLTVLYADTRMELPPLYDSAMKLLEIVRERGHQAQVVLPELDDRFFVYMFGRGVPPPKNRFRWCTAQLKIEPMQNALKGLRASSGEKLLMLTGVRVGESAARDGRIAIACGRDGAECGQGWFQETTPESIADTLAPLLHWRMCHIGLWLGKYAPALGWPTAQILNTYGAGFDEGDALEIAGRTGCVGCNLASKDVALDRLLKRPEWAYLAPLKGLKPLYAKLQQPQYRLRKEGELKADGELVSNPGRLGPLTMDARRMGISEVINIEVACNFTRESQDQPKIDLINFEEFNRIDELIEANTWPNRWFGTERTGDELLPLMYVKGGGQQHVMTEAFDA